MLHLIFALAVCSAAVDSKALMTQNEYHAQVHGGRLKLHWSRATWRNARLTCYNEGAVLASPENDDLMAAMTEIMSTDLKLSRVLTGIHDTFSTGLFHSLEGTPLTEMPATWAPGKPDSGNTESCLSMDSDGKLIDNNCYDELPFMCYKNTVSLSSCGPAGYTYYAATGSCYKFHPEDKYWRDAFAACDQEDAHLAIINSKGEAEVLKELFSVNFHGRVKNDVSDVVHIGFVDWGKEGGLWMTIHGQTLEEAGYANWHSGEPNNATNQFCGGMFLDGTLDDVNCYGGDPHEVTRSFICEKKPKYTEESFIYADFNEDSSSSLSGELMDEYKELEDRYFSN